MEKHCICGAKATAAISKGTFYFESRKLGVPKTWHPVTVRQLTKEGESLVFSSR